MKKIAIIGAGISGLFFANLLKNKSNYDFTIFEKKKLVDVEDGYGIQLSVNSIKILNEIGFANVDRNQVYNPDKINFFDIKKNKKICELDISKFNYSNNKYTTLKRSTLIQFLLNNILKDKIRFNTELKEVKYSKKLNLVFSENYTEEFDYLIVSDGVFSKTKSIILKKDTRPKYFDSLAIRGNISDYKSKDISLYLGPNFHIVIYPVNQKKELNFISIIRKKLLEKNMYNNESFLKSTIQDLNKSISIDLNTKLKNIKSFPIYISKKVEISDNKNIFFVGDAFFTTPPSLAQGASQSIESCKELFEQIENDGKNYYKKRIKKLNSISWRSKLNYFSFHTSNSIISIIRNNVLKILVKNNKFLDNYLGKIYKD